MDSDPQILRIDIDWRDGKAFYGIGTGTANPAPEDDNLSSDIELKLKLDQKLQSMTTPPKVRIAAHGEIPFEIVEEILKALETRQDKNQIRDYAVEVNERSKL